MLFSCSVVSNSFVTPWTATHQASLSFTVSRSLLKLMSIELVMPSNHFILSCPLLLSPIFPGVGIFSSELALHFRWPKYSSFGFSIVLPVNIQSWFPLGLTAWSPCIPRDSQESSPAPQFESINPLVLRLLYGPVLTSIHDNWENHNFDFTDICWQSDVSAF